MSTQKRHFSVLLLFGIFFHTCLSIQVYETFVNMKLVPDMLPHPPTRRCNVTYTSKSGTLFLRHGQRLPVEYRDIHPNVTWPVRWNKTYCLYMAGISRWKPKIEKRRRGMKLNTTVYPLSTTFGSNGFEWHNWIVVNIPNNNVDAGQTLYEHLPIRNPVEPDVIDRYAFLVYEQIFGLINFTAPVDGNAYQFQELTPVAEFAEKYMLGNPIFGSCFINKWDPNTITTPAP